MPRKRPGPGGDPDALFKDIPPGEPDLRPEWSAEATKRTHNYPKHRMYISRKSADMIENMSDRSKRAVVRAVFQGIREGLPLESACSLADTTVEWLEQQIKADPGIGTAIRREHAILERELVRLVRAGGPGFSAAKASLEVLTLTFKAWTRKTSVTVATFIQDALAELKETLPAEHFEKVVKTLDKHAGGRGF